MSITQLKRQLKDFESMHGVSITTATSSGPKSSSKRKKSATDARKKQNEIVRTIEQVKREMWEKSQPPKKAPIIGKKAQKAINERKKYESKVMVELGLAKKKKKKKSSD